MTEAPVCIVDAVCVCRFLGGMSKIRKQPLSWPCLSWQSFWNNSDSFRHVFMKFCIIDFFLICRQKSRFI